MDKLWIRVLARIGAFISWPVLCAVMLVCFCVLVFICWLLIPFATFYRDGGAKWKTKMPWDASPNEQPPPLHQYYD